MSLDRQALISHLNAVTDAESVTTKAMRTAITADSSTEDIDALRVSLTDQHHQKMSIRDQLDAYDSQNQQRAG